METSTIHFVVENGIQSGQELHVPRSGTVFGSNPESAGICLRGDPALADAHCRFLFHPGDGLWLETLEENPVEINGEAVSGAVRLSINDTVKAGNTKLVVVNDERPVHLIIETGLDKGRHIGVPQEGIELGRIPAGNGMVIRDAAVSRSQCRLYFKQDQGLWVEDLGASNQTEVNHTPVTMRRLHVDDIILIGSTKLRVVNDGADKEGGLVERVSARVSEPAEAAANGLAKNLTRTVSPGAGTKKSGAIRIQAGAIKTARRPRRSGLLDLLLRLIFVAVLAYAGWKAYSLLMIDKPGEADLLPDVILPESIPGQD